MQYKKAKDRMRSNTLLGVIQITMKISHILFLLLLLPLSAVAAENFCDTGKPHPIDVWFEAAMKKTEGITSNIRDVQGEAYSRWDKELNIVYSELIKKLQEPDKTLMKETQRNWLKYTDTEIKWLWSEAMYGQGGTLSSVLISDIGRGYTRQRVCELLRYKKMAYEPNA